MNTINETGRLEIISFLEENHIKPENAIYCIDEWVKNAQRDLDNDEIPIIEIPRHHSVSGYAVAHALNSDCWEAA